MKNFEDYIQDIVPPHHILVAPVGLGWMDEEGLEILRPGFCALLPLTFLGRQYLEDLEAFGEKWYQDPTFSFAELAEFGKVQYN